MNVAAISEDIMSIVFNMTGQLKLSEDGIMNCICRLLTYLRVRNSINIERCGFTSQCLENEQEGKAFK